MPSVVSINYKNLDYEIETPIKTSQNISKPTINYKNLDYEIETGTRNHDHIRISITTRLHDQL